MITGVLYKFSCGVPRSQKNDCVEWPVAVLVKIWVDTRKTFYMRSYYLRRGVLNRMRIFTLVRKSQRCLLCGGTGHGSIENLCLNCVFFKQKLVNSLLDLRWERYWEDLKIHQVCYRIPLHPYHLSLQVLDLGFAFGFFQSFSLQFHYILGEVV